MGRAYEVRAASMAKTAAAKSSVYAKAGKEIFAAAKTGSTDPNVNLVLKKVIERAKKQQVPAHVIEKAIAKAEGLTSGQMTQVIYEGFGAGNVLVIVECLTDNVNRTVSEVRNCFTKTNGKLGVSGSVGHMFARKAKFAFEGLSEEEVLEILMENDCDVEDIHQEDDVVFITADPNYYDKIKSSLEKHNPELEFLEDSNDLEAATSVELDGDNLELINKMMTMLRSIDDVQEIYHNANNIN